MKLLPWLKFTPVLMMRDHPARNSERNDGRENMRVAEHTLGAIGRIVAGENRAAGSTAGNIPD